MEGFRSFWERLRAWVRDQWRETWKKGACLGGLAVLLVLLLLLLYFGTLGNPNPQWQLVRTISWEAPPGEQGEGGGEYVGDLDVSGHSRWRLHLIADADPSCVEQSQPEPCPTSFISVTAYDARSQDFDIDETFDQFSSLNEILTPPEWRTATEYELTVYALDVASWEIQLQAWY